MDGHENDEFTAHLRSAVSEAEALKYRPTQFKRMLDAYGGFETVSRILASGKPSDGFTKLWELGRLDLSCEAIVVEKKWRRHFSDALLAKAEKLLGEMGYAFKRFDGASTGAKLREPSQGRDELCYSETEEFRESTPGSNMRINGFFCDVLHAPVANGRWSWGSVDERTRRVFLRVWRMDTCDLDGRQAVRVLGQLRSSRPGWRERARHLQLIKSGYAAYAVVCDKDSAEARAIRDFDRDNLLRLGHLVEQGGIVYAQISGQVPVVSIAATADPYRTTQADLEEVRGVEVSATTRGALIEARLGQGRFRRELMRRWNGACAVTGCQVGAVLRASHCKPWRLSSNIERLDSNNGLILSATLDALFDVGLISFEDDGSMLVARAISVQECAQLGLPAKLLRPPSSKLKSYLGYHRDHVFQG